MTLDPAGVDEGLRILDRRYRDTDPPLSTFQRTAWREVLEKLELGELRPALASLSSSRRPSPLDVLQAVHEARRTGVAPVRAKPPPVATETIAKAREHLAPRV